MKQEGRDPPGVSHRRNMNLKATLSKQDKRTNKNADTDPVWVPGGRVQKRLMGVSGGGRRFDFGAPSGGVDPGSALAAPPAASGDECCWTGHVTLISHVHRCGAQCPIQRALQVVSF